MEDYEEPVMMVVDDDGVIDNDETDEDDNDTDDDDSEDLPEAERVQSQLLQQLRTTRTKEIVSIDLQDMDLTDQGAYAVAQYLTQTQEHNISSSSSSNSNCDCRHYKIERLNMGSNNISDEGAIALAEAIPKATSLTYLELGRNQISTDGSRALARALQRPSVALEYLSLQFNCAIHRDGYLEWANTLRLNHNLQTLYLCTSKMGDDGICTLAASLEHNKSLEQIWLCNNNITVKGATAMAKALLHNKILWLLSMDGNHVGDGGAVALARTLLHDNTTVAHLYIRDNGVTDVGTRAMIQAVKHNHSLVRVLTGLSNNHSFPSSSSPAEQHLQFLVKWNKSKYYQLLQQQIQPTQQQLLQLLHPTLLSRMLENNKELDECYYWIRNKPDAFIPMVHQQQQQQQQEQELIIQDSDEMET